MPTPDGKPLYRHGGAILLRAARVPLTYGPGRWPDTTDPEACREWLREAWELPGLAEAVRQASPTLAGRVDAVCAGRPVPDGRLRRAATAVVRYLLRATGRPTPFGLFAGVAHAATGPTACVRQGDGHRAVARPDAEWLADLITRLESCPDLLERLDVVFSDLAVRRGARLHVPCGPNRVTVRYTRAVRAVRDAAAVPVRFGALARRLAADFPGAAEPEVRDLLAALVRQGFLITCLRAPFTVVAPLAHLTERLRRARAETVPSAAPLLRDLEAVRAALHQHNHAGSGTARERAEITRRMRRLSSAGRTALAVDLLLDCEVRLPEHVIRELEHAADALVRLTRRPTGQAAWRDYHAAFRDRYGIGVLVPLADVVDPDAGLGYPAGYPGSVLPEPARPPTERHARLLALAGEAIADGGREILLTEADIRDLTADDRFDERLIPPHVELSVRVCAASLAALDRGEYTLTVAPARAAGTLTSRFTPLATGSGLAEVYRAAPVASAGALPVQLSFPPVYPHAENICRVPAYLPHVLPLGEHRDPDQGLIRLEDLAVTATRDRLHLVSLSRRRVVEPQVFHALALEKQPPPLARFLAHLPRAFAADWHDFDWGPHADRLPYLPRVRHRRTVLAPARWRLTRDDLRTEPGAGGLREAVDRWRHRRRCPAVVELRDADRTLRLALDEPAHVALLHAHLMRHGHAVLTETAAPDEFGWLGGHVHEIAVPLLRTGPPAPPPRTASLPRVRNASHGQPPGAPDAAWLYAKLYTHPERQAELIAEHLPVLLSALGDDPPYWFVRYRGPQETDHLRLRIGTPTRDHHARCLAAVGAWARRLRREGVIGRLVFDTYVPETGRYGHGAALAAAEAVFAADSRAVAAGLRRLPAALVSPVALAAVSMLDIADAFLGGPDAAAAWLLARPAPAGDRADRAVAAQAAAMARRGLERNLAEWPEEVRTAWRARAAALARYRERLAGDADTDAVLESLLHLHHNRALGIDPAGERACRRLSRQAALARRARPEEGRR